MTSDCLVSIIIPVFNVRPYLAESLESVLNQTCKKLEIIIIDDGSTDGSSEICNEYASKDNRIRIIYQTNQGLSAARNVGLDIMSGDAVAFFDSDDKYHPEFIRTMINTLKEKVVDIGICRFSVHKTNSYIKVTGHEKAWPTIKQGKYNRIDALNSYVDGRINPGVWNKLYRRKPWEKIRFRNGHVFEDIDTMFRILDCSNSVYVIDQTLYYYRKRKGSITDDCSARMAIPPCGNRESGVLETVVPEIWKPQNRQNGNRLSVLLNLSFPPQKGRCPAARFVPQRSGPGSITRSGSCPDRTPPA